MFKDSLLYHTLTIPEEEYRQGGVYRIVLRIPFYIVVFTVGILIALIIDFWLVMVGDL